MNDQPATRDLVLAATVLVGISRFVDGELPWVMATLLLGAMVLAGLQLMGDADPAAQTAGVPIESVLLPALVAVGGFGAIRLVPLGLLLIPALAGVAWLIRFAIETELRLARSTAPASNADRTGVLVQGLVAAFGAVVGVAILTPGGLPSSDPSTPLAPASISELATLAFADGMVAFLLGYRVAALRSSNFGDVAWSASLAAVVVAIAAAVLRSISIPGVLGPALLVLVLFLWDAAHGGAPTRRRDPRRRLETALLVVLALVVVGWSLGLRG